MKKEIIASILFVFATLIVYAIFPTENAFQNIATMVCFLLITPLIFNLFVTKKPLKKFGLTLGMWREGILWSFVSLVFAVLIFYIIFSYTEIFQHYLLSKEVSSSFGKFLIYEATLVLPFIVIYDFFFRGFCLIFFKEHFNWILVIAQAVLFGLVVLLAGSFDWYFFPYILFSFFSGIIAYKSESILYSIAAQIIFMIIVDASVIGSLQ